MADDILNTIEALTTRAKAKEEEANKLKKLVNELCAEAGMPIRFETVTESRDVASIRSDQFYGLPLTTAIRNYLEIRKASGLGAATVIDIYRAIRDGGYKFDTKNEDNARIGVGNALRKTSAIFHRLPNGQYGLLGWYPSARPPTDSDESKPAKRRRGRIKKQPKTSPAPTEDSTNAVTNKEVRDVITTYQGNFKGADIEKAVKAQFPQKTLPPAKVATVIFILKKKKFLEEVTPRSGKTGATFCKAGRHLF